MTISINQVLNNSSSPVSVVNTGSTAGVSLSPDTVSGWDAASPSNLAFPAPSALNDSDGYLAVYAGDERLGLLVDYGWTLYSFSDWGSEDYTVVIDDEHPLANGAIMTIKPDLTMEFDPA